MPIGPNIPSKTPMKSPNKTDDRVLSSNSTSTLKLSSATKCTAKMPKSQTANLSMGSYLWPQKTTTYPSWFTRLANQPLSSLAKSHSKKNQQCCSQFQWWTTSTSQSMWSRSLYTWMTKWTRVVAFDWWERADELLNGGKMNEMLRFLLFLMNLCILCAFIAIVSVVWFKWDLKISMPECDIRLYQIVSNIFALLKHTTNHARAQPIILTPTIPLQLQERLRLNYSRHRVQPWGQHPSS